MLPELTGLLEAATGGPVTVLSTAELARRPQGVVLPLDGGRGGALLLHPTVAAWSDPASPARTVLARLLDSMPSAPQSIETESVAGALLDGFETERRELAERLHRGVLQSLIGSRYLFDLARTAEGRSAVEALGMAREAVQEALSEGRALLRDVTPRVGDRTSLE
jgi:signal transduction histidine kinase